MKEVEAEMKEAEAAQSKEERKTIVSFLLPHANRMYSLY
jgi:hypothetical protein